MEDIEAFSTAYRAKLDEAELAKFVPENLSLEVPTQVSYCIGGRDIIRDYHDQQYSRLQIIDTFFRSIAFTFGLGLSTFHKKLLIMFLYFRANEPYGVRGPTLY
jgi:hypothetical protein